MRHISFKNTNISGGFWKDRQELNRKTTFYSVTDRFAETGRFEAFKFSWKDGMANKPHVFWDSDVAKWMEAAAYILQKEHDAELQKAVEDIIDLIEKNQDPNGYFNVYFTVCEPESRFTRRIDHELYCAGHLIEAAVAYFYAANNDRFLNLMCKYADHIEKVFKIDNSAEFLTPGHEEIELALVKLYRCTGKQKYLELSRFFIDKRGNNTKDSDKFYPFAKPMYDQSHVPVRQQTTAEGHAVRACYLYSAMADLAAEYGDDGLTKACKTIFNDIINKKMYITGGIGQSHVGEAFTSEYDLPNKTAYAETCAAISLIYFAHRMLVLETDSVYGDIIERALYNGMLSGISLDGEHFFYENPLEIDPSLKDKDRSIIEKDRTRFPITQRAKIFDCSCCPSNIIRFIASMGDFIYSLDNDTCFIHQYIDSELHSGGISVRLATSYPNDGKVSVTATGCERLAVRIPGWCDEYTINRPYSIENGYAYIDGTDAEIEFIMKPVLIQASPRVRENGGRVAVQMGPLIFCLEEVDNGPNLRSAAVCADMKAEVVYDAEIGANTILADGICPYETDELYSRLNADMKKTRLRFIPYFAFANRGESEMIVWINYRG